MFSVYQAEVPSMLLQAVVIMNKYMWNSAKPSFELSDSWQLTTSTDDEGDESTDEDDISLHETTLQAMITLIV